LLRLNSSIGEYILQLPSFVESGPPTPAFGYLR
jgi:hypothetical protein